jgi:hypothetical protein
MLGRFNNADVVYTGRLHVYNIDTEQVFTIATNQADSEVLLIEADVVYYRSANRLYAANITESGIGKPRLLANDDVINDAHWAFIRK